MSSSGIPAKNLSNGTGASSLGDPPNDRVLSGQSVSAEFPYNDPPIDHVHILIKAFESLIVPIIRSHLPASASTINGHNNYNSFIDAHRSTKPEREAEQLLNALKTFIGASVRSHLGVANPTESHESSESAIQEEKTTLTTVQRSQDRTIEVSKRNTPNPEQSLLQLVLQEARHQVFNTMPIRLLAFERDGSGIELVERGAMWHRISTAIETDLNESNIKYVVQQWATPNSTGSMSEEQKRKAGINALVRGTYTRYAILSHTWLRDTPGELTYADWQSGKFDTHSPGYRKLVNFCRVAAADYGLQFGWMDTICINKESSSELDESIRSMFSWYRNSDWCITYLADTTALRDMHHDSWFTRGWTLQELLAPHYIKFYGVNWQGVVPSLENEKANSLILEKVEAATTITRDELERALWTIPISRRMQWAANRCVTREEDTAYSLMGIFNVSISTAYGEGSEHAFVRLVKEMLMSWTTKILDILNWGWGDEYLAYRSSALTSLLLPTNPRQYLWRVDREIHWRPPTEPVTLTHLGLRIPVLLMPGASVDPLTPNEFHPIGNYYASAKDVALSSPSGTLRHDFHLLEKNPKNENITHRQMFIFFGVLNLLETAKTVELPSEGECFAVPLHIDPRPTTMGVLPEEFTARRLLTARAIVIELRRLGTDSFIIPKRELPRHGMTLRTLYL